MKLKRIIQLASAFVVILLFCNCIEDEEDIAVAEECSQNFIRPNLPSTWQTWEWNGYSKFPSLYFAAEPEGNFSPSQMAKINKHSLAIIEFKIR